MAVDVRVVKIKKTSFTSWPIAPLSTDYSDAALMKNILNDIIIIIILFSYPRYFIPKGLGN